MEMALTEFPCLTVTDDQARRLGNGMAVPCPGSLDEWGSLVRIYHENGSFISIGKIIRQGGKQMIKSQKWLGGR